MGHQAYGDRRTAEVPDIPEIPQVVARANLERSLFVIALWRHNSELRERALEEKKKKQRKQKHDATTPSELMLPSGIPLLVRPCHPHLS